MHLVLVIEDDAGIRDVLRVLLEARDYRVVEAANAQRGLIEARAHKPDLLLVDLGLPDGDGISLIREVRSWSAVPILVLSARTMDEQKVAALDAGADDYVTKPFSTPELLARIRAALRRRTAGTDSLPHLEFGKCCVDLARREARNAEGDLHLTPLEYRLLDVLASHAGLVVRTPLLLREVWGPGRAGDTGSLRVSMRNLRQKLEPDPRQPRFLLTEVGLGYRLRLE
jgi:two-component system KDP operon response regulator KdpE